MPDQPSKPDALVVFMPSGRRGRFPLGTPLLQAARSLGVDDSRLAALFAHVLRENAEEVVA